MLRIKRALRTSKYHMKSFTFPRGPIRLSDGDGDDNSRIANDWYHGWKKKVSFSNIFFRSNCVSTVIEVHYLYLNDTRYFKRRMKCNKFSRGILGRDVLLSCFWRCDKMRFWLWFVPTGFKPPWWSGAREGGMREAEASSPPSASLLCYWEYKWGPTSETHAPGICCPQRNWVSLIFEFEKGKFLNWEDIT